MATTTLPETEIMEPKPAGTKYVYFFGGGKADGNGKMKDVLGGKGAGLAEMTNAGLARASRLHHPDRSLPRIHAQERGLGRGGPPDGRGARKAGAVAGPEAWERARTLCWSACVRARSSPCRA